MRYTHIGGIKSRGFRTLWMLEELGEAYELVNAAPRSDDVRAVNPTGKIPVLIADGTAISDSSAILTFLADRHGALTAPAGSVERGQQDAMLFRILDDLDAVLWTAARHSFILPEDERVPEVKPTCKAEFARNVAAIGDKISGPYVMGDAFTVVDIVLTHCCGWSQVAKFDPLPDTVTDYLKRTRARAAYGATMAL